MCVVVVSNRSLVFQYAVRFLARDVKNDQGIGEYCVFDEFCTNRNTLFTPGPVLMQIWKRRILQIVCLLHLTADPQEACFYHRCMRLFLSRFLCRFERVSRRHGFCSGLFPTSPHPSIDKPSTTLLSPSPTLLPPNSILSRLRLRTSPSPLNSRQFGLPLLLDLRCTATETDEKLTAAKLLSQPDSSPLTRVFSPQTPDLLDLDIGEMVFFLLLRLERRGQWCSPGCWCCC